MPEVVKKAVPEVPTPVPKKVEAPPAKGIANLNIFKFQLTFFKKQKQKQTFLL